MAHWAQIDENNFVINVLVMDNNDPNGDEGYQWLIDNLGGTWIKTSYNTKGGIHYQADGQTASNTQDKALRKNHPGVGYTYDAELDAFIPPKPFDSWVLDETTCWWQSPIPYPTDGKIYSWNEETESWDEVE